VHLLVYEQCGFQNARCNNEKKKDCIFVSRATSEKSVSIKRIILSYIQEFQCLGSQNISYVMCGETKGSHMTTVTILNISASHLNEQSLYETPTIWRLHQTASVET
jgi:hypothetical protein